MKLSRRVSLILAVSALAYAASAQTNERKGPAGPLTLIHATPLPEIVGDFDHFAVDARRNHLFVSAEVLQDAALRCLRS